MDEKRKVLELVEKGLISADEALELLEALENAERQAAAPDLLEAEEGDGSLFHLDVNVTGADIYLAVGDGEKVTVVKEGKGADRIQVEEGPMYLRLYERREIGWERLLLPSVSASARVRVTLPRSFRLRGQVRTVSGDVQGELPSGRDLLLRTVSGDMDLMGAFAAVEAHSVSGDLRLRMKALFPDGLRVSLHTVSGDVRLVLPRGTYGIRGQGSAVSGDVDLELPGVERKKQGVSYSFHRAGDPAVDLRFKTVSGDVAVREGVV
ncbi:MAG: DUF4097 family beta strand repeat-containing protein [Bacillota bacterium]|nr:DUF4097 family beta strand repeat-containing protein [Bacillota bacterium]